MTLLTIMNVQPTRGHRGTPRAMPAVRARISHTATGNRRLDLFVTCPVIDALGWQMGGAVGLSINRVAKDEITFAIQPRHEGWRLHKIKATTGTARIAITTELLAPSVCAPVRAVPYEVAEGGLLVKLPAAWISEAALEDLRERAAAQS